MKNIYAALTLCALLTQANAFAQSDMKSSVPTDPLLNQIREKASQSHLYAPMDFGGGAEPNDDSTDVRTPAAGAERVRQALENACEAIQSGSSEAKSRCQLAEKSWINENLGPGKEPCSEVDVEYTLLGGVLDVCTEAAQTGADWARIRAECFNSLPLGLEVVGSLPWNAFFSNFDSRADFAPLQYGVVSFEHGVHQLRDRLEDNFLPRERESKNQLGDIFRCHDATLAHKAPKKSMRRRR